NPLTPTMNYFTYIIQSESTEKLYVGQTNNIQIRLLQHNSDISLGTKVHRKYSS
ncbi:MAG: GIY-YIG nuclease family protein, partial [Ignavibacteria bacterium]|nr:GIY-YIG nuclease family protein [Ignavibacteria bacterium]